MSTSPERPTPSRGTSRAETRLAVLACKSQEVASQYRPLFFRLSQPHDQAALESLITDKTFVHDEILGQVEEYVKSVNPTVVYTEGALTEAAKSHMGDIPYGQYGVWVYYPWSDRLVHTLDENEFVEVRTNRNQYKITPEEREILFQKKIGIIGLSVGQSIAVTIALERICGELRIADFDILELSNLNRIRTGIHNLGISKTVVVAREIAEIDPYFKVTCFHQGASEANIDDFILNGGKLDILLDECDGLVLKILCRQRARHHGVPVVMDTADRGMLDVERFDLEPERPILHGFIDHLDINKVKEAITNEEKIAYLIPMLGLDTVSTRMKASMLEIEQSITTWPQLASSVVMGGGLGADVCRRILLDRFHDSGRYFVDVEQIIGDEVAEEGDGHHHVILRPSITEEEMLHTIVQRNDKALAEQIDPGKHTADQLVQAAAMAPTGANLQPWKWIWHNKHLYLFFDHRYSAGLLDCEHTTSFVGLGAATENLVLKAHELGLEIATEKLPLTTDSKLVAVYRFFLRDYIGPREPHICDELAPFIPQRLTNRNIGQRVKIAEERLLALQDVARTIPGVDMRIISDEQLLAEVKEVTGAMDRIRITHKGGHRDFLAETRWTPEEAHETQNGIDLLGTMDLTPSELAGWRVLKDWKVVEYLNLWNKGKVLEKLQRKKISASSAVGLITVPEFSCDHFFTAGRALERVWLAATKDNICVQPASLSTLIFNTVAHGDTTTFPPPMLAEALAMLKRFDELFSIDGPMGKVILFRFFIGDSPVSRSVRYPVERILARI
jgi:molybdopterin/thiamine biosynthesis adenylyltransferase